MSEFFPEISVVMPVYNHGGTVADAARSVLGQTFENFELVAVNDGSDDDTARVLNELARQDLRIRVLHREHAGIAQALNAGIKASRGALIARMDADDECRPERLELQRAFLRDNPGTGLVSCLVKFGGDTRKCRGYDLHVKWANSLVLHEDIALARFIESPFPHPSVMFRRELVERFGGYADGAFPEDYELWLRWLEAGIGTGKVNQVLLTWNDPPGRLSRMDPRYAADAFYRVKARYLARWLSRHNRHHPEIYVAGAGRDARKRAEHLTGHGIQIAAYVDIDPKKIGYRIKGRPVIHRDDLPRTGRCFVVSYVASRGARKIIRQDLTARGFVAGRDFIFAA